MTRGQLVVFTTPAEGREDDFNSWYDDVHIPELLELPGFLSATRYKVADNQLMPTEPPGPYLALYDIEGDDLLDVVSGIRRGMEDGSITPSDATSPGAGALFIYEELTERREP